MRIHLSHAEVYLCCSAIWRVWGSKEVQGGDYLGFFELYGTELRDVEIEGDAFLPIQQKDTKWIRAKAYSRSV